MTCAVKGTMGESRIKVVDDYLIIFEFELKIQDKLKYIVEVKGWEAWDVFMLHQEGRDIEVTGRLEGQRSPPWIIMHSYRVVPVPRAINLTDLGKKINMLSDARRVASEKLKEEQQGLDVSEKTDAKSEV